MLTRTHPMDDRALIAETNRNFYRALAARDMPLMDQVWLHADWVGCVHPGWTLLTGWATIRESWVAILSGDQQLQIIPSQVMIHIENDLAWVTCLENITALAGARWQYSLTQATNLFQRVAHEWKM